MWARILELALACWLAISPFVFHHSSQRPVLWYLDLIPAALIAAAALVCYHPRLRKAHLLQLGIALSLLVRAFLQPETPSFGATQNHIIVGLLLGMLGIVPCPSSDPPAGWKRLIGRRTESID